MNFSGLLFLLSAHFICGLGILSLFRPGLRPLTMCCLSLIIGVPIVSLAPCVLQLLHCSIDAANTVIAIVVLMALCAVPLIIMYRRGALSLKMAKPRLPRLYELPFLLVCVGLSVISVWRCFYFPPTPGDMLTGPELLAEYTVREKTMINSVFTLDFQLQRVAAPNIFKSPYITCLQIEYKLLVHPFGQLWLSVLFLSFTTWLYTLLRSRIHALIAAFLLLFFLTIPELYAYTFMIMYDYSNMVFFFAGFIFLIAYTARYRIADLALAALLFGLATYIRNETLIFIALLLPAVAYSCYRQRLPLRKSALMAAGFILVPILFYLLCMDVFVHNFVPLPLELGRITNSNPGDLSALFQRLQDILSMVFVSAEGVGIYGYFIFGFMGVLITDIAILRRFNREALLALYGVGVVYLGLGITGYLLPGIAINVTIKRSMFKALPIMALYMSNSGTLLFLADKLNQWEYGAARGKPATDATGSNPISAPQKQTIAPTKNRKHL